MGPKLSIKCTDQTADAQADLSLLGAHVSLLVLSCCGSFLLYSIYSRDLVDKEISLSDVDLESAASHVTSTSEPRLFDVVDKPTFQPYSVLLQQDQFLSKKDETFLCSELCPQGECGYTKTGLLEKTIEKLKRRNACLVRHQMNHVTRKPVFGGLRLGMTDSNRPALLQKLEI